jgi:hypothetical protein
VELIFGEFKLMMPMPRTNPAKRNTHEIFVISLKYKTRALKPNKERIQEINSGQAVGTLMAKLKDWRTKKIVVCNCKAWF